VRLSAVILLFLIATHPALFAQDLIGLSASNYGGLYRATYNPSVLGGSRYKWQLNAATVNSTISNRYFQFFGRNSLLYPSIASESSHQLYGRSRTMGSLTTEDPIHVASVLHLPSLMISLGKIHGVGLQVRSRGFVQGRGIPADIRMLYSKRLDTPKAQGGEGSALDFQLKQHSFTEVAFSYGVQLLDLPKHKFRAGASVKYLAGGRTSFVTGQADGYQYGPVGAAGENQLLLTEFSYQAGYTNPIEKTGFGKKLNNSKYGQGIAMDAGVSYEVGSHWYREDPGDSRPGYVLRLAASVTDFGRIRYNTSTSQQFGASAERVSIQQKELETIANFGPDGFRSLVGTSEPGTIPLRGSGNLPAMLHLEADLQLFKAFFVYASRSKQVKGGTQNPFLSITQPNHFTIGPRWENEDSDYSFPVSFIEGKKRPSFGITGRVGPVHIGFSDLLGLLGKGGETRASYGYLGLSFFHLKTRDYRKKIKWKPKWD
jgi:hypothetical protein